MRNYYSLKNAFARCVVSIGSVFYTCASGMFRKGKHYNIVKNQCFLYALALSAALLSVTCQDNVPSININMSEWGSTSTTGSQTINAIAKSEDVWVAVGANGTTMRGVDVATDGIVWDDQTQMADVGNLAAVAHDGNAWIAVGANGVILRGDETDNTLVWSPQQSGVTQHLNAIAHNNNTSVAVGNNGTVVSSADGVTWNKRTIPQTALPIHLSAIAVGETDETPIWVTVSTNGYILTSTNNGASWSKQRKEAQFQSVAHDGNLFAAVGHSNGYDHQRDVVYRSSDGIVWIKKSISEIGLRRVAGVNKEWIAIGASGFIATSTNAIDWQIRRFNGNPALSAVATDGAQWVIFAKSADSQLTINKAHINPVDVPGPNLIVESFSVDNQMPEADSTITMSATVKNSGTAPSEASTLRYYLSPDTNINPAEDLSIDSDIIPALAAGASSSQNGSAGIPDDFQTFYVAACVDTVSNGSIVANNCTDALLITVSLLDLLVTFTSVDNSNPSGGDPVTLSAVVLNAGNIPSTITTLTYYKSSDNVITTNDTYLDEDAIPALTENKISIQNTSFNAPTMLGAHHYGACVTVLSLDANGDNNCSDAVTITVVTDDIDNDGVVNADDVDRDNNGLIEIDNLEMLNNIRYNLDGTSYDDELADSGTGDSGSTNGAPKMEDATGDYVCANPSGGLCGYELTQALDFANPNHYGNSDNYDAGSSLQWRANDSNPDLATNDGWQPIGGSFSAIFEGNTYTVSNLYLRNSNPAGLFGATASGATIRNIGLINNAIYGSAGDSNIVGALVGNNDGTVSSSYANGVVDDGAGNYNFVGGLVGENNTAGTVSASYASGAVGGSGGEGDYVGGLVGFNKGSITGSNASGAVDGGAGSDDYVGGLVGRSTGTITASYANGAVDGGTGSGGRVGGLVGRNDGTITASYTNGGATVDGGDVGGGDDVGGLVGENTSTGVISTSYANGTTVDSSDGGSDSVGGLVGTNKNRVVDSYAINIIVDGGGGHNDAAGGLVGNNSGASAKVITSYVSGAIIDGGTGNDYVGGLVGYNDGNAKVIASYATDTTANGGTGNDDVGGLVGASTGTESVVVASYAADTTANGGMGDDDVGGLVGYSIDSFILSCYATASANGDAGTDSVGGLVGYFNGDTITISYASSTVDGGEGNDLIGALIGESFAGDLGPIYASENVSNGSKNEVGAIVDVTVLQTNTAHNGAFGDPPFYRWTAEVWTPDDPIHFSFTYCDSDGSGSIETEEVTESNYIWDFGSVSELPTITCTPTP